MDLLQQENNGTEREREEVTSVAKNRAIEEEEDGEKEKKCKLVNRH